MKWLDTAGDIASASTALGGLLLVFIGSVANGYAAFAKQDQPAVRWRHLRKGLFAFAGFVLALVAAGLALAGKVLSADCLVAWSSCCLGVSFVVVFVAALFSVSEIH